MNDLPERGDCGSRVERRRERSLKKAQRRRATAIAFSVSLILIVLLGAGGWVIYRRASARRGPTPRTYAVTLPEGLNATETGERFEEATNGSIKAAEFSRALKAGGYDYSFLKGTKGNLEGFLFPNTYQVTSTTTARETVDKLLCDFKKETDDLEWNRAAELGVTPYQIVIIASLIEKEVKLSTERPLVASVIYNRLKKNMKLGMCSTVLYALGQWKPKLTNKDIEVDSPYNTYKINGLPPGPICNPGFESIRASLFPATTDYLYFILTGPEGSHSFTSDYRQFDIWKNEQNKKQ
ncbi:MAG: endolytic transglycosylase MltG [Candidatus Anoxymicrobium japonicum]|uniref:Endolytic murein transglycosylase n=1 Tax=Candidatus Anoxymicrobium japonicum TaxID=2013648 RepID=A0A2N3G7F8_9ACTN|nr:MAG: endolytic transglycosylase MltG [Candidatus Anoxymicrobium japonicum]